MLYDAKILIRKIEDNCHTFKYIYYMMLLTCNNRTDRCCLNGKFMIIQGFYKRERSTSSTQNFRYIVAPHLNGDMDQVRKLLMADERNEFSIKSIDIQYGQVLFMNQEILSCHVSLSLKFLPLLLCCFYHWTFQCSIIKIKTSMFTRSRYK